MSLSGNQGGMAGRLRSTNTRAASCRASPMRARATAIPTSPSARSIAALSPLRSARSMLACHSLDAPAASSRRCCSVSRAVHSCGESRNAAARYPAAPRMLRASSTPGSVSMAARASVAAGSPGGASMAAEVTAAGAVVDDARNCGSPGSSAPCERFAMPSVQARVPSKAYDTHGLLIAACLRRWSSPSTTSVHPSGRPAPGTQ